MLWFDCLYSTRNLQKLQSFHSRTIDFKLWNLIPIFIFLVPVWIFLFYEAFMKSFWFKYWQRQGRTSLRQCARRTLPWFMLLFLSISIRWFFSFACAQSFDFAFELDQVTKTRTLYFPPSVASMDEVIHSAPWRPWMKSSIVPAALPPIWSTAFTLPSCLRPEGIFPSRQNNMIPWIST